MSAPVHAEATLGARFGAWFLDALIAVLTLGIGWMIWSLFTWRHGQSPGKRLVGLRCVDVRTGRSAGLGTMVVRELIGKSLLGTLTLGITTLVGVVQVLGHRRAIWDSVASTTVVTVYDDQGAVRTASPAPAASATPTPWPPASVPIATATTGSSASAPSASEASTGRSPSMIEAASVSMAETSDLTAATATRHVTSAIPIEPQRSLDTEWGEPVALATGTVVLIGRDPIPRPEEGPTVLEVVPGDCTTVSKTHVAVHVLADRVLIEDRHSHNGTIVHPVGGTAVALAPGDPVPAGPGTEVHIGEHWFRVSAG